MEVENGCLWKVTSIGDTPIFHWTGGRVPNLLPSTAIPNKRIPTSSQIWVQLGMQFLSSFFRIPPKIRKKSFLHPASQGVKTTWGVLFSSIFLQQKNIHQFQQLFYRFFTNLSIFPALFQYFLTIFQPPLQVCRAGSNLGMLGCNACQTVAQVQRYVFLNNQLTVVDHFGKLNLINHNLGGDNSSIFIVTPKIGEDPHFD